MNDSRFTLPTDEPLGTYRIERPLSSGAMGAVYRGVDTASGAAVAIKHVRDTRLSERFEVEARLLSVLRHPRVVRVIDYMQDERGQFLVMDLVEGVDLHALLKQHGRPGLPLDDALEYTRQACEALRYVHQQQIVHRDVKPQNIILGEQGVVLVDFGVARLLTEDGESGTLGVGTPRFMAPEVFAGGAVSPRSDVFGLAATLWTLLVGKPPVYADPLPLAERVPGLSPQVASTIKAGLEMIPERRLASIEAFSRALGGQAPDAAEGRSLARSVPSPTARRALLEAIVRTAAAVFQAAACSIALTDGTTGELVYQSAWGAGAKEIVGVRLSPGKGLAGSVVATGEGLAVADCRGDERFAPRIAAGTGYVPYTMLVAPLLRGGSPIGAISLLDRRDGRRYEPSDLERLALFAELTIAAIDADSDVMPSLGADEAIDPF